MRKYLVTLESGRDLIIEAADDIDAMYAATDEAALHDDYLTDVEFIPLSDYEKVFPQQLG